MVLLQVQGLELSRYFTKQKKLVVNTLYLFLIKMLCLK